MMSVVSVSPVKTETSLPLRFIIIIATVIPTLEGMIYFRTGRSVCDCFELFLLLTSGGRRRRRRR
jgi:hypothetical protein